MLKFSLARAQHCHWVLILPFKDFLYLYLGILKRREIYALNPRVITKADIAFIRFVRICLILCYAFNIGVYNFFDTLQLLALEW